MICTYVLVTSKAFLVATSYKVKMSANIIATVFRLIIPATPVVWWLHVSVALITAEIAKL